MKRLLISLTFPCLGMAAAEAATLLYHLDFDSTTIPDASSSGIQSGVSNSTVATKDLAAPGSTGALLSPCASSVQMSTAQSGLTDGSFVFSFWVNLQNTGTSQAILTSGRLPENSNQARKLYFDGNTLNYGVHADGAMTHNSGIAVTYGEWANIAIYYDSTVGNYGQLSFSLNGQITGSPVDVKASKAIMSFDNSMHLGMTPFPGNTRQYLGANTMLDEMKIYSFDKNAGDDFAAMAYNEYRTGDALAIPETSTAVLGMFGFSLLLFRRKQR